MPGCNFYRESNKEEQKFGLSDEGKNIYYWMKMRKY